MVQKYYSQNIFINLADQVIIISLFSKNKLMKFSSNLRN